MPSCAIRCLPGGGTASRAPACLPQTCVLAPSVDRRPELPPALPLSPFKPSARAAAPGSCPSRDGGWEDTGHPWGCREDVLLEAWGRALRGLAPRGCRGRALHKAQAAGSTLGTSWVGSSSAVGGPWGGEPSKRRCPAAPVLAAAPPRGCLLPTGSPPQGAELGCCQSVLFTVCPSAPGTLGEESRCHGAPGFREEGAGPTQVGGALLGNVSELRRPRLRESGRAS